MRLLALDLATRAGYCAGDSCAEPAQLVHGYWDLPPSDGGARGATFLRLRQRTLAIITDMGIERVVLEAPILPKPFIKNVPGRKPFIIWPTRIEVTMLLQGLVAVVEVLCEELDIPCTSVTVQEVKKMATGDGGAEKAEVVRGIQRIFPRVTDDNEADAISGWLCGVYHYHRPALERFEKILWGTLV